jgi:alkylation response protein AidB-like acyl-CoA dehydrogenase
MNNMGYAEQSDRLAGPIALLKAYITRCTRETAEDATQVFGGRGITVGGMGGKIENVRVHGRWWRRVLTHAGSSTGRHHTTQSLAVRRT